MSVATEFPPDVYIPAGARRRDLKVAAEGTAAAAFDTALWPAAPAAAALGAGVIDLDRWRPQFVGTQVGGRRRNVADLRTRPVECETRPVAAPALAPVRLTRRGLVVVAATTLLLAAAVVLLAWLSAPGATTGDSVAGSSDSAVSGDPSAVVTVGNGESLWSIATRVAPNRDPRAEVDALRELNDLTGDTVTPGQHLRVR